VKVFTESSSYWINICMTPTSSYHSIFQNLNSEFIHSNLKI